MESTTQKRNLQVAEIQLAYKTKVKPSERPKITSSQDAYEVLRECWDDNQIELSEHFRILLLNRANNVIGQTLISMGGIAGTVADPKIIFAVALKSLASAIILAHNHPSGNLNPSQADIDLTQKLKAAGKFLELPVLDHIIITNEGYFSFADKGVL